MDQNKEDARLLALRAGVGQLNSPDIIKILEFPQEKLLLDGGNYNDGRYCPLAVALDAPDLVKNPDDGSVRDFIGECGRAKYGNKFVFNQMRGTPGRGYRDDRLGDLLNIAHSILNSRVKVSHGDIV